MIFVRYMSCTCTLMGKQTTNPKKARLFNDIG